MLVSICIPTFNGEEHLQEALNSVKAQTFTNFEVIISDDKSEDNTIKICKKFKSEVDFPVHIYENNPQGIGANWNHSIEKANGKYIKLLFQDDVLNDNCIEKMMSYLENNNLEIVISKREIIDASSARIFAGEWFEKYNDLQSLVKLNDKDFFVLSKNNLRNLDYKVYSKENFLGEPCVSLFSKKLYKKTGGFDTNLKQALDYLYWLRVLRNYDIGIIGEKLVQFRFHDQQASAKNSTAKVNEGFAIENILFSKFLCYIDAKSAKSLLKKRYSLIRTVLALRYKIFP